MYFITKKLRSLIHFNHIFLPIVKFTYTALLQEHHVNRWQNRLYLIIGHVRRRLNAIPTSITKSNNMMTTVSIKQYSFDLWTTISYIRKVTFYENNHQRNKFYSGFKILLIKQENWFPPGTLHRFWKWERGWGWNGLVQKSLTSMRKLLELVYDPFEQSIKYVQN